MLDIKLVRENPELIQKNFERRNNPAYTEVLKDLIKDDKEWRKVVSEINELRELRNKVSMEIAAAKKEKRDASDIMKKAANIPKEIQAKEEQRAKIEDRVNFALLHLPNLLHESVPDGRDESQNKEIVRWGEEPKFDFEPKNHLDILKGLGMIDEERAAKSAGHGFYYLKGDAVLLDMALQRYALDFLSQRGMTVIQPPYMLRTDIYQKISSDFFEADQVYQIPSEKLSMIATAEHPIAAMMSDETIEQKDLPLAFAGISPAFRKEVGAHGKYTKGLFRVHQFNKVEQFVFCHPDDSWNWFDKLQENTELIFRSLGIHHRVMSLCTGDMGKVAAKTIDTEAWMADGNFREMGSCSNCTDYQARRIGTRFRESQGKPPVGFVHTLNSTAIATGRAMVAILEQFQREDGSVAIPEPLVSYMNGRSSLEKWKE